MPTSAHIPTPAHAAVGSPQPVAGNLYVGPSLSRSLLGIAIALAAASRD